MEKIRFGVIGLGNQGTHYIRNLFGKDLIENGVVTAVCDVKQQRIDDILSGNGAKDAVGFLDYKQMLDSGLIDAVLIETPHYLHPEMVEECLKRDINVICDKPAGVYTKQVVEMIQASKKSKAMFAMMFNQRTNCVYRKMKEIVQKGEIGDIQRVNWIITDWFRTQAYYDGGSWRATWSGEGGGVLINQCPHQIDLVQWVVGQMPSKVRGFCKYGRWHDIEVEDEVTAYFEYANGATGVFITTTGETPGTNRFEISGTKGKLLCENNQLILYKNDQDSLEFSNTTTMGFARPECQKIIVETDGQNPQHKGIINNFANALLGLEPLFVNGEDGLNGVELMNAIELSGWNNGEEITLPVDQDRYLKELQEHCENSKIVKEDKNVVADTASTFGSIVK